MGFRGSQTAELVFDECKVPAANLLGEENKGVRVVMSGLDLERSMISPINLGIAERALALSLDYARQRKQFGKPIADFQMVQSMLAERSEEHTSELQSLMRISYAVFCLKKKKSQTNKNSYNESLN